jgi:hypothetical protein
MSQERTLVVILCMHRCGSSLTARLFQRLGMSLGPFDLGEANESNKYGHFEAQPFVLLNREVQLRQFDFEGDLPDEPDALRRFLQIDGRWTGDDPIPGEAIDRGRDTVARLMRSGTVCGFKDPRTVLVWPYWREVLAGMPGLRVVPIFLVRSPHEIAMSIVRRSQGDRDYDQALNVTAVHFRRMKEIRDQWPGPCCAAQFDPRVCGKQLQQAAALCGLPWSDTALADVYDASCRHHEAAVIEHPAQVAFEALAGPSSGQPSGDNDRQLLADALAREAILRRRRDFRRQEQDVVRQELVDLYQYIAALQKRIDELERDKADLQRAVQPLEASLCQANHQLGLMRNSRTWRIRAALVNVLGRAQSGSVSKVDHPPQPDGQDAQSPATGLHYSERKDHAGN